MKNRASGYGNLRISSVTKFSSMLLISTAILAFPCIASAQTTFTPEHVEVKAMADKAVGYLRASGEIGEATLSALAIVQYYKRYEGRVPKDNAGVNNTVNRILGMFPDGGNGQIMNQGECYFPALALILLAEVDAVKYKDEIIGILKMFDERQTSTGAFTYLGQGGTADTSQTQFVALAMWVAKTKEFDINLEVSKDALNWLCTVHGGSGQWAYKYTAGRSSTGSTLSMQAAGLSSVYLLADALQLNARRKDMVKNEATELGFPKTVSIYVAPVDGKSKRKEGPLIKFDRGLLGSTTAAGNRSLEARFQYDTIAWNYYYLYAIERYAYFREQAEGDTGNGPMENWYDGGIEFLKKEQRADGSFPDYQLEKRGIATAFALLFMVRSSQIINFPPANTTLNGGNNFATDSNIRDEGGRIGETRAEQNLQSMLDMLGDDKKATEAQLKRINSALKKQIVAFKQQDNKSKGEVKAFLRSMVGANNYYRRMIAVRFLAAEQDMDNVPALIYALSDPSFRVAMEAHDGLRLVSRKVDTMSLSKEAVKNARRATDMIKKEEGLEMRLRKEFDMIEDKWIDWYTKIRPDAELLSGRPEEDAGK